MDESRWMTGTDVDVLLNWLQKSRKHRPSRRKLGLFACACTERLGALQDDLTATGLQLAERMADGLAGIDEWRIYKREFDRRRAESRFAFITLWVMGTCQDDFWTTPEGAARGAAGHLRNYLRRGEELDQCRLLREVLGNLYRPVAVQPDWLAANARVVASLARAIYDEKAFERMPILGDALEDAGCADAAILAHCRGPNGHVRGCWLLDLILRYE